MRHNRSQRSRPPWPPKETDQPRAKAEPPTDNMYSIQSVVRMKPEGEGDRRKHPLGKLKLLIHTRLRVPNLPLGKYPGQLCIPNNFGAC